MPPRSQPAPNPFEERVFGRTEENTFDYSKPFSKQNLDAIMQSGDQRTAMGQAVQIFASNLGSGGNDLAWDVYDIDQHNFIINTVNAGWNQLADYVGKPNRIVTGKQILVC